MNSEDALRLLQEGYSNEWNAYRSRNPAWEPDLRGFDLSMCDLVPEGKQPFDLSNADLCGATMPSEDRVASDQRRTDLKGAKYNETTRFASRPYDLAALGAVRRIAGEGLAKKSVFLSYAHQEVALVERYEDLLKSGGVIAHRDRWDFLAGEKLTEEIKRIMESSDAVLIFYSAASRDRKWTNYERNLAQEFERRFTKGRPVPVIVYVQLDETPLPPGQEDRIAVVVGGRAPDAVCQEIVQNIMARRPERKPHRGLIDIGEDSQARMKSLGQRIRQYMIKVRNRMPRTLVDPNEPKFYESWTDNLDGMPTNRFIIYLRSSGCRWAIATKKDGIKLLAGCLDCEHSLAESTFGKPISSLSYISQFAHALAQTDFRTHPVLCVYNEGNFFNSEELPPDARETILKRIADIPEIRSLIVESLPEHLPEEALRRTKELLGDREFEVGIGLESSNPVVRKLCVNKSYTLKQFDDAVKKVKRYAKMLAYVLLKPSFLSDAEALEDTVCTSRYAFEHGVDIVSIEPVNISQFNMSGELNRIGRYRPCWLWTIVEAVCRASKFGPVRLGGEQFAPKYAHHPFNCPRCNQQFYNAFQEYNRTLDLSVLTSLDCECRADWERDLNAPMAPLLDRIDSSLQVLETAGGFKPA